MHHSRNLIMTELRTLRYGADVDRVPEDYCAKTGQPLVQVRFFTQK
jgi:hypothetical protein